MLIGFQKIDKDTRSRLELLTSLYDGIICSMTLFKGLVPINERWKWSFFLYKIKYWMCLTKRIAPTLVRRRIWVPAICKYPLLIPFFVLISYQSRFVVRLSVCHSVRLSVHAYMRTNVRAVSCNCISFWTAGRSNFTFYSCICHTM